MAKPALIAVGVVLVAAGGAAAGYGVTRKATGGLTPEMTAAISQSISELDGDLKAARAAMHERVTTLKDLQAVRAVVGTDRETAKDMMSRGELAFTPAPGEVIEIGQVTATTPKSLVLLVSPESGQLRGDIPWHRPDTAPVVSSRFDPVDDMLMLTELDAVTPADKSNAVIGGYVADQRSVVTAPALKRLAALHLHGTLDVGTAKIEFGTASGAADPKSVTQLPSIAEGNMSIDVPAMAGGRIMGLVAGGGGAAGLGLIMLVVGLVTGKRRDVGRAETQLSVPPIASSSASFGTGTPLSADQSGPIVIPPHGLPKGAVIGRWEIVRRLGSGGMADVYLAHARGDAGFEKLVALKVMHPFLARNQRAVEHFLDEARLAARVVHPNVVSIQDLGKIGDDYVIVMDYVDGIDLERLLAAARAAQRLVPLDVGLGILCRICDGLEAAHKATGSDGAPLNIIHRDVKSANVLVSKQGGVKVVDFGIAKAATQSHLTVAGETKGTPSMMAPEQRVGEQVDVRADVYSVAAVGYEIVTGHGVNLDLAALAHLGIENWPHLPPPTTLRPGLPPELDKILLTAMAFERDRRPADCIAFETQLEAVMKQHGYAATDKDIARWVASELAQMGKGASAADQFPQV